MALSKIRVKNQIPAASNQDMISSLPTVVTDKILELLPLQSAAQMSVLSKKWRKKWLSLKYLVFDAEFWATLQRTNGDYTWQKMSNIISNILFHHNPSLIHKFHLYIPDDVNISNDVDQVFRLNISQWISFLSTCGVEKIVLVYWFDPISMPSRIFTCEDLVELHINKFVLMPPPCDFKGFAFLRSLELLYTEFSPDTFRRLTASCPRLRVLRLVQNWNQKDDLVIDVPKLKHLSVEGLFETLTFKNSNGLQSISLKLYRSKLRVSYKKILDIVNLLLACSSELRLLHFDGDLCKILAAGGSTDQFTQAFAFNKLRTLSLSNIDLGNLGQICFGMIQSCPCIEDLKIVVSQKRSTVQHQYNYNDDLKWENLRKVEIKYIIGSTAEVEFIKYVLAVSAVLEKLLFVCSNLDPISELKLSRKLLQLPRASTKAKLVCLEQ